MDALRTDLYQLTMAAGYFHRGMSSAVATCELFVRRLPRRRRYLVAMGLERALHYLEQVRFTEAEVDYLASVPSLKDAMTPAFRRFLLDLRFTGDVDAMPEGTLAFAEEPLLRVRAPIVEAQLVETFLLSVVNHATMIASKAARIVEAAKGASVMEFGTRRTHPEAALDAARAAYCAGFVGTSNLEAGMRFGIPVLGTAAHMWTMAHPSEEEAFAAYVAVFPNSSILLIDTYDTLRGAARAATIARDKLKGVRLDSGDLLELSRAVRVILDEHGCASAKIVASGDLNEHRVAELNAAGAPIDVYGIGTELVTSLDAPALGGVYKLVSLERDGKIASIAKFSEGKGTLPGPHQVYRYRDDDGRIAADVIALADEVAADLDGAPFSVRGTPSSRGSSRVPSRRAEPEPLLAPVMRKGQRVASAEPLEVIRERVREGLLALPADLHLLEEPTREWRTIPVHRSPRLAALTEEVRAAFVSRNLPQGAP